jgi:hypothetical protein
MVSTLNMCSTENLLQLRPILRSTKAPYITSAFQDEQSDITLGHAGHILKDRIFS